MGGKNSGRRSRKLKDSPPLAADRMPYERQPKETDPAWRAFVCYRDDPERSQQNVSKALGKSRQLVSTYSIKYRWRERVEAWDREADDRARAAKLDEIEEMQRRHIQIAQGLQQLAALELQRKLKAARANQKEGRLSAKDLKELADLGTRLERLNRGEPETYAKVEGAVQVITVGGKAIKF